MRDFDTTFKYIGLIAIGLLLFGLAGWYIFLSRKSADLEAISTARGFDIGVPSFSGSRGSTAENITTGFGASLERTMATGTPEAPRPPRLWRVSASPVAGAGFVAVGSSTQLRYVERSTGHVFDADPRTGAVVRRTNKLIPKVYEAMVDTSEHIIARSLSDDGVRSTYVGTLGTTTIDGFTPLTGSDLGSDIEEIAFTPDGKILFSSKTEKGITIVASAVDGSKRESLLSLFAGDFDLDVLMDSRIVLMERPASGIRTHAYTLKNGTLTPIVESALGLTIRQRTIPGAALVGNDDGKALRLTLITSSSTTPIPLAIQTTAQKCVWAPGMQTIAYCAVPKVTPEAGYLSNWYRGTVHTTDKWFTIEPQKGVAEEFLDMESDLAIDVERPLMDTRGDYVAFISARDKSLWILRIIE